MQTMLDAALGYAAKGWPIFPCNTLKEPIGELAPNGVNDATTDPATIRKWWGKFPLANIGFNVGEAGMMALDYDPGSDRAALDRNIGGLPKTGLVQQTPRGGIHEFYALHPGELVPSTASIIAPNIDVRSFHGYVLLPPSRTANGVYTWLADGKPAHRTDEMRRKASEVKQRDKDHDNWLIKPDLPEHIDAYTKWLREDARISVEGQGGDHNAYATAAMGKSYGISEETAFDLMWEHWNPRCSPPWTADEADHLQEKVAHAYEYNTSPPGNITSAYRVAVNSQHFKPVEKALPSGRELSAGRFRFVTRAGMAHIPPASWLIRDVLTDDGHVILFGAPGTFKTFVALDMGLSVATGFPQGSIWGDSIVKSGPVLMAIGEGRAMLTNRVRAWERLHWGGQQVSDFVLSDPVPSAAMASLDNGEWKAFCDGALELHPNGYAMIIVDTIRRSMAGLNENSQEHASGYSRMSEYLRERLGGTVLGLHHVGHEKTDREVGSGSFAADADTRLRLERAGKEMSVKLTLAKQKDGPDDLKPWLIRLEEIELEPATKTEPAVTSLAATAPKVDDKMKEADRAVQVEAQKALAVITDAKLDDAVMQILYETKPGVWNDKQLAEKMLQREDFKKHTFNHMKNNLLPGLRRDNETRASKCVEIMPSRPAKWSWRAAN